jgi:gas vesicle protein
MRSTTTRRLVAGFTAGVAAVAASAVLLLAPSAADAGHSLRAVNGHSLGHSL